MQSLQLRCLHSMHDSLFLKYFSVPLNFSHCDYVGTWRLNLGRIVHLPCSIPICMGSRQNISWMIWLALLAVLFAERCFCWVVVLFFAYEIGMFQ